jgi:hypothetical protein
MDNTSGSFNTALGSNTLTRLKTGINSVAVGIAALNSVIQNGDNTAVGAYSLQNTTTWGSTAMGTHSL